VGGWGRGGGGGGGGGGLKEAAQAITKQLTYIGHLKFLLACIGQAAA